MKRGCCLLPFSLFHQHVLQVIPKSPKLGFSPPSSQSLLLGANPNFVDLGFTRSWGLQQINIAACLAGQATKG